MNPLSSTLVVSAPLKLKNQTQLKMKMITNRFGRACRGALIARAIICDSTKRVRNGMGGITFLCLFLILLCASMAGAEESGEGKRTLEAMTVNLYLGSGTERILALNPTDPNYFP